MPGATVPVSGDEYGLCCTGVTGPCGCCVVWVAWPGLACPGLAAVPGAGGGVCCAGGVAGCAGGGGGCCLERSPLTLLTCSHPGVVTANSTQIGSMLRRITSLQGEKDTGP